MTKPRLYPLGLLAIFISFMGYPLSYVLLKAFFVDGMPSLVFFRVMAETEFYREALFNSLNLAILVTVLSSALAYPLAFALGRYALRYGGALHALLLLPLVVPPFVGVLGVRQLFSRFGSVNVLLLDLGLIQHPIDWLAGGGVAGIVALQTLHLVPVLYLSIRASLQGLSPALEESALMSGASRLQVLRSIVLPLSFPGWFAGAVLVFIGSFTDLGTPLIFEYRKTVSVQIYNMLTDINENPVGYSFVVFTCFLSVSLFLLSRASLLSGAFAPAGRVTAPNPLRLVAGWKRLACYLVLASYIGIALMPQASLCLLAISGEWFMSVLPSSFTARHFGEVLSHPITLHSLATSLWLSATASALTVAVGFLTAYVVVRGKGRLRVLFEVMSIIPLAVPGIVFAFGYVGGFAGTPLDNRANPFPLLIAAYMIRRLPSMVRSASAGLQEASQALEEAAFMVGASPLLVYRRIVMPLISRHLAVGALLTFAYSMIEVSDGLLLALEERFYPVSKAIYALMGRPDGLELGSALGVIVMVIMGAAFFLIELFSKRGRAAGAALGAACILACSASLCHAQEDELVIVSSHWEGIKREFEWGFSAQHLERTGRAVSVRWLDLGGASDIVKYLKSQHKRDPGGLGVDVIFSGGPDLLLDLKASGILQPVTLSAEVIAPIPKALAGVPLYDSEGAWYAAALSTFGIVYNKVALARLGLSQPETWSDLARPEYHGLVGAGDPRKSGSMHAMFEVILQGYGWNDGWRLIQQIAGNVRNFSGTASQIGKEVATAEIVVGIAIDTYGGDLLRRFGSGRIGFVVPSDFAAINGDGIAVIDHAPHPELARSFVEFVLSERGQRIFYDKVGSPGGPRKFEIGKLPVLPALYGGPYRAPVVDLNPFTTPGVIPYQAALAARRWNLVNDLFGSFIMDAHDRLVERARDAQADGTALAGIPVSSADAEQLLESGPWGSSSRIRSEKIREWGAAARAGPRSRLSQFSWVPSLLLALVLLAFSLRQAVRRRG